VLVETEGFGEESVGVVDQSVDAPELLEGLDSAGDEETPLGFDGVVAEEIGPFSGTERGFVFAGVDYVRVECGYLVGCHPVCV